MNHSLLAALLAVETAGFEVNDVVCIDAQGEVTNVAITWDPDKGMTRYIDDDAVIARSILRDLTAGWQ